MIFSYATRYCHALTFAVSAPGFFDSLSVTSWLWCPPILSSACIPWFFELCSVPGSYQVKFWCAPSRRSPLPPRIFWKKELIATEPGALAGLARRCNQADSTNFVWIRSYLLIKGRLMHWFNSDPQDFNCVRKNNMKNDAECVEARFLSR
jgi:hypothetical protein